MTTSTTTTSTTTSHASYIALAVSSKTGKSTSTLFSGQRISQEKHSSPLCKFFKKSHDSLTLVKKPRWVLANASKEYKVLSQNICPTIKIFLIYKKKYIEQKFDEIVLTYLKDNYSQDFLKSLTNDDLPSSIIDLVCASSENLPSSSAVEMKSKEKDICKKGDQQNHLSILWKDEIADNKGIRYALFERLISSYLRCSSRYEKDEELGLDELIRKNDFYLRIERLIKKIDKKHKGKKWDFKIFAPTIKNIAKTVHELALEKRFFFVPSYVQRSYGLVNRKATSEDLCISNCILKLTYAPCLRKKFKDIDKSISGMTSLKLQLFFEVLSPIFDPCYFKHYGQHPPNGILFYGSPGGGKTHCAKVLAKAAGTELVEYSPGTHGSHYHNLTSVNIQKMFDDAKSRFDSTKTRTTILCDELESVLPNRGGLATSQTDKNDSIEQFLRNMESCAERGILFIGTTNFKKKLDRAAIRPGRIDMEIEIPPPSEDTRKDFFQSSFKDVQYIDSSVDITQLVALTLSFPISSIKNVVKSAAQKAASTESRINMKHFKQAIDEVSKKMS